MKTKWISIVTLKLGKLIILFLFFTIEVNLQAAERYDFYNGIRQMSMGGASIGVVNDETALISNPAGLAKLRNAFLTLIDPELTMNGGAYTAFAAGNLAELTSADGLVGLQGTSADNHHHTSYKLFPSVVLPNFGIGLYYNKTYNAQNDSTGANLTMDYRFDMAAILGYNVSLFDGRIKIGMNGRYVNRVESSITNTTGSTGNDFEAAANLTEGTGFAIDAGVILTAPWALLPSLALVVRDFADTSYEITDGINFGVANDPASTKQTIDAAFSLFPIHGNHVRSTITFEMKDTTNALEEEDANRRYHFGYELNAGDFFFLRAGMNQKYWTAGLEIAMERMQFQIGSWGVDVGEDNVANIEDRRYAFKFSFRF